MPTFYEGDPVVQISYTLERDDFVEAYYEEKNYRSFFSRREVKGGIFLSLILLIILTIPSFYAKYGTFFTPAVFIALLLVLFYFFVFTQTEEMKKTAKKIYDTNCFLKLENKVSVYRDSLIYENQYEKIVQYLTDFVFCMESSSFFILKGGEKDLLILKKEGLDQRTVQKMRETFSSSFASKFIQIKVGWK